MIPTEAICASAVAERLPERQYTAYGALGSRTATRAPKSADAMSMLIAPGRWPCANSSGVRTSMIVVPGSFRAAAKPAASSSDPLAGADDAVGPADTDATAPDVLEQPARPKARAAAATVGTSRTWVERVGRDERVTTGS